MYVLSSDGGRAGRVSNVRLGEWPHLGFARIVRVWRCRHGPSHAGGRVPDFSCTIEPHEQRGRWCVVGVGTVVGVTSLGPELDAARRRVVERDLTVQAVGQLTPLVSGLSL